MEPAGALSVAGLKTWVTRPIRRERPICRGAERRQHELRSPALRRRTGRTRRGARSHLRRDDPGAPGRVSRVLRDARARAWSPSSTIASEAAMPRTSSWVCRSPRARTPPRWRTSSARPATRRPTCRTTSWPSSTCATWSAAAPATHAHERLCRFEFPERPGALLQFLETLGGRWNISLFHYRNHGADFGRVLAGFEVPDDELGAFKAFLDGLGYPYLAEFGNDAYRLFLE